MAGIWEVIIPISSEDRNECTNPSFETGTSGWTTSGSNTISAVTTQQVRGAQSLEVTYQNNTILANYSMTFENQNSTYYLKAWVRVDDTWDGGDIRLTNSGNFSGSSETNVKIYTDGTDATGAWIEMVTTLTVASDVTGTLRISTSSAPTAGEKVYIDAVYFGLQDTEYYDGDSDDAEWEGLDHASKSILPARSRSAGVATNLDDYQTYITAHTGTGLPPVNLRLRPLAFQIAADNQGWDIPPRSFSIVYEIIGTSLPNLHQNKRLLVDAMKPDLSPGAQPVVLRYLGAGTDKQISIRAFYEGGLDGGTIQGFTELGAMRFLAADPLWFSHQGGGALDTSDSASFRSLITQEGSTVENPISASGTNVNVAKYDNQRRLWIGGTFTAVNGTTVNRIAYLDPDSGSWTAIGGGTKGVNGTVNDIDFLPNGDVVIVGDFTTAGGSSANRIVRWDGSSFNTYGTGMNLEVLGVLVHSNGDVFACGAFTTANGVSVGNIAFWNGSTFDDMDGGATAWPATMDTNVIGAITERADGMVIAGGNMSQVGTAGNAVLCEGVAAFYPGTDSAGNTDIWSFAVPGDYVNHENTVGASSLSPLTLAFDSQGYLYVGGNFDTSTYATPAEFNSLARVNPGMTVAESFGGGISYLGTAAGSQVNQIRKHPDTGQVWICGRFDEAGGSELPSGLAIWTGEIFTFPNFDFPGTTFVVDVTWDLLGQTERVTAAFTGTATITHAGTATITNSGSALTYPVIKITRSGGTAAYLKQLGNASTNLDMLLDYSLADGETVTIDTRPGMRSIRSDTYGNILGSALVPLSDFANFYLLPGDNSITAYVAVEGGPTITTLIWYDLAYWAIGDRA